MNNSLPQTSFVSPITAKNHICPGCLEIPNPETAGEHTFCGQLFCKACKELWITTNGPCPTCKLQINDNIKALKTNNLKTYQDLSNLQVSCTSPSHLTETCAWKGKWKELEGHIGGCLFALVKCRFNCDAIVPKKLIDEHEAKNCPNNIKKCKYETISCPFKGKGAIISKHEVESDGIHLVLALKEIEKLKATISDLKQTLYNVSCHGHVLKPSTKASAWFCNGRDNGGCKSGRTNITPTTDGVKRFRCDACDFDLCEPCLRVHLKF